VVPGTLTMLPNDLPPAYHSDIVELRRQLEIVLQDIDETALTYDGLRLRASKLVTPRGETWVALRLIETHPPALDALGFTLPVVQALHELGKREGLVLICGGTGQGKSTTAGSMLYDYLTSYGGVAITIEDPVEYPLEGRHGESGLCYQVDVKDEADWAKYLKRSLRWHPRYILLGELRTPEAANQLLRAANSGHLAITTLHSGSLEEGLEGVMHLGEQAIGPQAPILLASGLAAVLYQTFLAHSVLTRLYVTDSNNLGDPVRSLIRERKIGQATTYVDQQMARQDQGLKSPSQQK
jgi:twitching motility protein PilT